MQKTDEPTSYILIGTDVKLVLSTDWAMFGGKIQVEWKCYSLPTTTEPITAEVKPVTSTLEMAEAVLTGNFTLAMASNYGCSGRGLFDPFARTIGSHVDAIDAAFFKWKKCIQCASGNDKSNVSAYSYDADTDTCGKLKSTSFKIHSV